MQKNEVGLYTIPQTKQINNLNVRAKTIKLLEESMQVNPHDLRFDNGFLTMTLKALATEEKIDKLDLIKI